MTKRVARFFNLAVFFGALAMTLAPDAIAAGSFKFFVEPYGGLVQWGLLTVTYGNVNPTPDPANPTALIPNPPQTFISFGQSLGLGVRLGAMYQDFYFACIDFLGIPQVNTLNSPVIASKKWRNLQFGVTAGVQLPNAPVKLWIGFNPLNQVNAKAYFSDPDMGWAGIPYEVALSGTSFKAGIGARVYAPMWVNLEFHLGRFNQYSNPATGVTQSLPSPVSVSYNFILLSVSVPFTVMEL